MRTDDARTYRFNEVRFGVVALVVEDQELGRVATVVRRAARELIDQCLRQLRLASPEVADDADVQLIQLGVAWVEVIRLPFARAETVPDLEENAQVRGSALGSQTARRRRRPGSGVVGRHSRTVTGVYGWSRIRRRSRDRSRGRRRSRWWRAVINALGLGRRRIGSGFEDQGLDPLLPEPVEHHLVRVIAKRLFTGRTIATEFDGIDRAAQPGFVRALRLAKQHLEPSDPPCAVFPRGGERLAAGHKHFLQHFLARRGQHGGRFALF